jgi:hypothetical protein
MRTFFLPLIIAVAPQVAHGLEVPKFKNGGFLITLQAGAGVPHLDGANLNSQIPLIAPFFESKIPTESVGLGLRLAYNILGFVSVGVDFTATGWNVFDSTRGGAGFLVGLVAIHPLQFFFINKEERPIGLDFSLSGGAGYGIVGVSGPPALGMDGVVGHFGLTIDYFLNRYFGLEFFAKCNFLGFDRFYFDWDSAHQGVAGAAATLNPRSGGTWWHTGLALVLRIGD